MRIKLYADNPNYRDVKLIVDALRSGEVVICPTSSGYTYICDALQTRAVETLCKIKRIDPKKKGSFFALQGYEPIIRILQAL